MTELLALSPEVEEALRDERAVVALETTIVAHGFPPGQGLAVGLECERRVRATGAVPATVAVLDGVVRIGLAEAELERVSAAGPEARKAGPRDLAMCVVERVIGATTVGGTLAACQIAGVRFMATGGIGGVHRGFAEVPDVSADVSELSRTEAVVVCSGAKSLLDVQATVELLETLGVPVLGLRTDELPLFYAMRGGPPVSQRAESPEEVAQIAAAHWQLGRSSALVLARAPDPALEDVEPLIEEALAEARRGGVAGQAVTPFVLAYLHEHSGGRTLEVNRQLVADNAALAGDVAVAYGRLR